MALLLKKYKSYGRTAGTISLPDATQEECEAARMLFGRSFLPPLRIKLAEFESKLQETRYGGVSLKELLEAYFSCTIQTKNQERENVEAHLRTFLAQAKMECGSDVCHAWIAALGEKRGNGYTLLHRAVSDGQDAQPALTVACRAVDWLETHSLQAVRLAVLSAKVCSDPHALDTRTLCGDLFVHLLAFRDGCPTPSTAEERDQLYFRGGILNDSISSSVTQLGLILYTGEDEHPAFQAFRQRKEVCTLTLTNLAGLSAAASPSGRVYLVENQMVFSQLCDCADRFHSPLICTSGQPQVAVLRTLDLLAASGNELYYSGDFDGKGLSIATQLFARYGDHLHFWHITPEDYLQSRSDMTLTEPSVRLLQNTSPVLAPTVEVILKYRQAGYQELLLSELLKDLTET